MMRRQTRRYGFTTALALTALAPLKACEVRIWPTAVVSESSVLLTDVASFNNCDPAQVDRLNAVRVSAAPRVRGSLDLEAGDVRAAMSEAGVNLAVVQLIGAARCRVDRLRSEPIRMPRVVTAAQEDLPSIGPRIRHAAPAHGTPEPHRRTLETVLKELITARLGEKDGHVEIRFSPTSRRDLERDCDRHQFKVRPRDENALGLVTFEVDIASVDEKAWTVPIIAEVAVLREVVVARRTINRGETIEARHLKLESRRFTELSQMGLTDVSLAVGQQARQFVRAGDMLMAHGVEGRPIVRRGDSVTIWIRQGNLVIKSGGVAQESGALGEKIDVARDGSRRKQDLIEAVVTGPSTVTLGRESRLAFGQGSPQHE